MEKALRISVAFCLSWATVGASILMRDAIGDGGYWVSVPLSCAAGFAFSTYAIRVLFREGSGE